MAISKHIIDLTTLALKDRVLTFVERKVIIDAAMKEGVSADEINFYLDNALNERLRSYSKEDLKRCPNCGAQIPLVSDECPYCGQSLETADNKPTPPPYIRG
ncbi:MAG: zinc ribbon domain-containing protein, partial [Bacteroidales bacterium]|nr:zinc ribbon domain-containing protein [Bacteroidales bacterium]